MSAFLEFLQANSNMLQQAIVTHLFYVFVSVAIGFVLGVLFGILLSRLPSKYATVLLPVLSVFQTIPAWYSSDCCSCSWAWCRSR